MGVIVDHKQDEYHTEEDVSEDVGNNDGDDDLVEAAALLLRADWHRDVLCQLYEEGDAGGHAVQEGQCVHCQSNVMKLFNCSI